MPLKNYLTPEGKTVCGPNTRHTSRTMGLKKNRRKTKKQTKIPKKDPAHVALERRVSQVAPCDQRGSLGNTLREKLMLDWWQGRVGKPFAKKGRIVCLQT